MHPHSSACSWGVWSPAEGQEERGDLYQPEATSPCAGVLVPSSSAGLAGVIRNGDVPGQDLPITFNRQVSRNVGIPALSSLKCECEQGGGY